MKHLEAQSLLKDSAVSIIRILNEKSKPIEGATIKFIRASNNETAKTAVSDINGVVYINSLVPDKYYLVISFSGYETQKVSYNLPSSENNFTIKLNLIVNQLQEVSVTARKPYIQHIQGKTIINVEAAVTNTGATVLEVLEKSPGIIIDRNGGISLQGKPSVLVMIDDKPSYLSGTELTNLLSTMNASQIEQIELITNPSAKYDASGNAGVINIKSKKNQQKGFNGIISLAVGQGKYAKTNNSILLNYRKGKLNSFINFSTNASKSYTEIYALRTYFNSSGSTKAILEQPTFLPFAPFNNILKTGFDYSVSTKTTIGLAFTGTVSNRDGDGEANAIWKQPNGTVDSTIKTLSSNGFRQRNAGLNLNLKHTINKYKDISIDVDWIGYKNKTEQYVSNQLLAVGGYTENTRANFPSQINIFSGKTDYVARFQKNSKLELGIKSSYVKTDNTAAYETYTAPQWKDDLNRSNHFIYDENINALYGNFESKYKRITMQLGLRYEFTQYNAHQLGNSVVKDSAFTRNYSNVFPSGYITYQADSSNAFTLTVGRRVDRPPFQFLNPFIFIINKYTYQKGNANLLPQYSWNFELTHQYKQWLTTTATFSIVNDYFSQLFITDTGSILGYAYGNVGKVYNLGLSVSVQAAPFKWWSFTATTLFNHKELNGYVSGSYNSSVDQLNININNQLKISKSINAEFSGFYISKSRNDLQELLYSKAQLSAGFSVPAFKNKATFRFTARDIFYSPIMEGLTDFQNANEYFILHRDTRTVTVGFTYRFGKQFKTVKRNVGGAGDEKLRMGDTN